MTHTQFSTIVSLLRQVDERVDRMEQRLAYEMPTAQEMRDQLSAELDSILAPGGSLKVFADD